MDKNTNQYTMKSSISEMEGTNLENDLIYQPGFSVKEPIQNADILRIENNTLRAALLKDAGTEVHNYISSHVDLNHEKNILFSSETRSYTEGHDFCNTRDIINLKKVNEISNLNDYFRSVNKLLPDAGIFIGCAETYINRRARFENKFGKFLTKPIWVMDFIVNRVIPRLKYLENVYFALTNKKHIAISRAEVLGRLVYAGFEIIEFKIMNNMMYFVVIKTKEPLKDQNPSYHPLIKLRRVGKGGKMIGVYKLRTMHPYSEYLQDFVLRLNGYSEIGKPADDFRVTNWGKTIRKYWLDEFPQLINVLKGEMKLVGIRPLSLRFLKEYPEELKQLRFKYKPGCVPPYVALLKQDLSEYIESEKIYLMDKQNHPYTTDLRYFFKAVYNIFANKIRSA